MSLKNKARCRILNIKAIGAPHLSFAWYFWKKHLITLLKGYFKIILLFVRCLCHVIKHKVKFHEFISLPSLKCLQQLYRRKQEKYVDSLQVEKRCYMGVYTFGFLDSPNGFSAIFFFDDLTSEIRKRDDVPSKRQIKQMCLKHLLIIKI